MPNTAKIVAFDGGGDLNLPAGATRTFTLSVAFNFTGRRFVCELLDTAGAIPLNIPVRITTMTHDNEELLANGRNALFIASPFAPPVLNGAAAAGIAIATMNHAVAEFHEVFCKGDLMNVTVQNVNAIAGTVQMYWITDYGE